METTTKEILIKLHNYVLLISKLLVRIPIRKKCQQPPMLHVVVKLI
jgi:hypothetical protein